MDIPNKPTRYRPEHCGVPQCNTLRTANTNLFKIPFYVKRNPANLRKWSQTLKIETFPKKFLICQKHFDPKAIKLKDCHSNKKTRLAPGAFPCQNLPTKRKCKTSWLEEIIEDIETESAVTEYTEYDEQQEFRRNEENVEYQERIEDGGSDEDLDHSENVDERNMDLQDGEERGLCLQSVEQEGKSIGVQCRPEAVDKYIQVNVKPYISIVSLWDTNKKLNNMTGIAKFSTLSVLVEICKDIRLSGKCLMPLEDRICLTMYKLKSNCSFAELAIFFQTSDRTAKLYFADTIQLLAKATKGLIHWQTKDENNRSLPKCFEKFPNVRTVLDCSEIKTATLNCLSCRVCTYSHYKGTHTLKFLIGVSPSGSINYLSKVVAGKSSDKAIFNLTDLISKLEQGDAVMVDKGFMIGDELARAGIEMVRPEFFFNKFSKSDVEKNTSIASSRVHVERRIAGIKQFRVLGDKICVSVIPYIDDILQVLCGLSNISPPILTDQRF